MPEAATQSEQSPEEANFDLWATTLGTPAATQTALRAMLAEYVAPVEARDPVAAAVMRATLFERARMCLTLSTEAGILQAVREYCRQAQSEAFALLNRGGEAAEGARPVLPAKPIKNPKRRPKGYR